MDIYLKLAIVEGVIIFVGGILIAYSLKKLNNELSEKISREHRESEKAESRLIENQHMITLDESFKNKCRKHGIVSNIVMLNILEKEVGYVLKVTGTMGLAGLNYMYSDGFYIDMHKIKEIDSQNLAGYSKLLEEKVPGMDKEVKKNIDIHLIAVEQ